MSVTKNETIKKLDEQIAQLQARKKAIENKEKKKAQKEHMRRLIRYGELVEKYSHFQTPEQLEEWFKNLAECDGG